MHNSAFLNNFHYQISGNPQGNKLVFLHGLMGSAANWRRIIRDFEADFEILAYDQRGHGRSFHPLDGYEPRAYAEDLRQILDAIGWSQIYLVGHSMGGRNALEFSHFYERRVIKLVLDDIGPDQNPRAVSKIERLLSLVPTPFPSRAAAKDFFENTYPGLISTYSQPVVLSRYFFSNIIETSNGEADWRFSKNAILQSLRLGRSEDRWSAFEGLKIPTLVVRGELSEDLDRALFQEMLQRNPTHAQGVEIAGAGHWVHFDQPVAFVEAIKKFFQA